MVIFTDTIRSYVNSCSVAVAPLSPHTLILLLDTWKKAGSMLTFGPAFASYMTPERLVCASSLAVRGREYSVPGINSSGGDTPESSNFSGRVESGEPVSSKLKLAMHCMMSSGLLVIYSSGHSNAHD